MNTLFFIGAALLVVTNIFASPLPQDVVGPGSETVVKGPDGSVIKTVQKGGRVSAGGASPPEANTSVNGGNAEPASEADTEWLNMQATEQQRMMMANAEMMQRLQNEKVFDEERKVMEWQKEEIRRQDMAREEMEKYTVGQNGAWTYFY